MTPTCQCCILHHPLLPYVQVDNGGSRGLCGKIRLMNYVIPLLAAITSLSEVRTALLDGTHTGEEFSIRATIDFYAHSHDFCTYCASDANSSASFFSTNAISFRTGDFVLFNGLLAKDPFGHPIADVKSGKLLGKGQPKLPIETTSGRFTDNPDLRMRLVQVVGEIIDVVRDDIDAECMFLVLLDRDGRVVAGCLAREFDHFRSLVGAKVAVRGVLSRTGGRRRHLAPLISTSDKTDVILLGAVPTDPFAVPEIDTGGFESADVLARTGRRRVHGTVVAIRRPHDVFIRTDDGNISQLTSHADQQQPKVGARILATGLPSTDGFFVNFTGVFCRTLPGASLPEEEPEDAILGEIFPDITQPKLDLLKYHGRLLRLRGEFVGTSVRYAEGDTINLICENRSVAVDSGNCTDATLGLQKGSVIEVVGVGISDMESFSAGTTFPRIRGFTIVPRSAADLKVISTPPWWTIRKLFTVVGILLAVLVSSLVWIRWLQRLIRHRSVELARMEFAKTKSDLRIGERTRLAVDIHDSLSQTLTGVSFQIDAANKTVGGDDEAARGFLAVAKKTLASCREELRRTLWDLRNNAIGEPNFTLAVERVLQPYAKMAEIDIQFTVPRNALSDSEAHDILAIVRELTVNAINHGKARHVHVVGDMRGGAIKLSVSDDGCGFDSANLPGPDEGHFGLQGVRERLNRLGGTIRIESSPSEGASIEMEIIK